jgi:excisionase family DNA binding protein
MDEARLQGARRVGCTSAELQFCATMKPLTPASAAHVIAESVRTQLGTDAVALIIPGSPQYAVVVAQAPDAATRQADSAAEPHSEPATHAGQHGEKLAYSVAEAALALGLSHSLIYDQLRTGRLGSLKVGRRRIITREHIDRFLAGP